MFADILARISDNSTPAAVAIREALTPPHAPASGTMKAWMTAHEGTAVHTVQIDRKTGAPWVPLSRVVDSCARAGAVLLNGSIREYAGMKVLSAAPGVLIVSNDWHLIAYIVA